MTTFTTEFSCGDKVYYPCMHSNSSYWGELKPWEWYVQELTVAKVTVQLTQGPKRQEYTEKYMCVETGYCSGMIYRGKSTHEPRNIYATKEQAIAYLQRKWKELLI